MAGFVGMGLLAILSGCDTGARRVDAPNVSASRAGRQAMEQYDTDGDGFVAGDELEQAPGLNAALENLDQDSDGKVSADEVATRIESWQQVGTGLTTINCTVEMDGRPLPGAEVTFDPEPFLGDNFQAAVGTTNRMGTASPKIPLENRPSADTPPGLPFGLYKVRVSLKTDGQERIPSKYNENTILGQEVADDDPRMIANRVIYNLESN